MIQIATAMYSALYTSMGQDPCWSYIVTFLYTEKII